MWLKLWLRVSISRVPVSVASAEAVHGLAQARQRPRDLLALVQRHTQAQHQADPEDGEDQLIHPVQLSKDHIGRDLLYDGPAGVLVQIVRQQIGLSLLADHGGAVGAIQGRHGLGIHKLLSQQLLVGVGNDIALLIVDIDLAAVGEHRLIEILQNPLIHQHHKDALPVKLLQGLCHGELIARAVGRWEGAAEHHRPGGCIQHLPAQPPVPQLGFQIRGQLLLRERGIDALSGDKQRVIVHADGAEDPAVSSLVRLEQLVHILRDLGQIGDPVAVQSHQGRGAGLHGVGPLADLPQQVYAGGADLVGHDLAGRHGHAEAQHRKGQAQHQYIRQKNLNFNALYSVFQHFQVFFHGFLSSFPGLSGADRGRNWDFP